MMEDFKVALLMGLLGLDSVAAGQFMLSRPIVVGPLVGWALGMPGLGLALGALVELIWIGDIPVGAHLPIDTAMLAGLSVACAARLMAGGARPEAAVTYALAITIPMALLGTEMEVVLRKVHVRWVHGAQRLAEGGKLAAFEWVNTLVLGELFVKGVVLAFLGLLACRFLGPLYFLLPENLVTGLSYAPWFLLAVGCSAAIELLVDRKTVVALVLSVLACAVVVAFFDTPFWYLVPSALFLGFLASLTRGPEGGRT